jgi:hypothetical protein
MHSLVGTCGPDGLVEREVRAAVRELEHVREAELFNGHNLKSGNGERRH